MAIGNQDDLGAIDWAAQPPFWLGAVVRRSSANGAATGGRCTEVDESEEEEIYDRKEYRRLVADVVEAVDAEFDLAAAAGPAALREMAIDREGRREAVRIFRQEGTASGDKAIDRLVHGPLADEFLERCGSLPAAGSIRRWDRVERLHGDVPRRSYASRNRRGGKEGSDA